MAENLDIRPYKDQKEEMTLKELILIIREYAWEIWRNKFIIALFCVPFLGWQGYKYFHTPTVYPANITFMIDDGEGGGSILSGIFGSLGVGNGQESNYDKIVALSKSMRIIKAVLLEKVTVNDVNDYLGNHLIKTEKINEEYWSKSQPKSGLPSLNGFLLTRDSFEIFTRLEYSAMKYLQSVLNGSEERSGIFTARYNEDSGIFTLSVSCRSEALSIALLNTFYDKLSGFYIEKKIEKNIETYKIVKEKSDSIRQVLNNIEIRQANFEDKNRSLLLNTDKVPSQRYTRDRQLLNLMYGESAKNLELADFAVKSSTPYIQLIDNAVPPLKAIPPSKKNALLLSIGLGGILGSLFVIIRKRIISIHKQSI